ncbi:hypothetical protein PIROE2DRAFT_16567 [Piromyces sp. E2]|nr:hypothetical protein PIROE2DRAFT_16567 [Piromyces sp. E2]|eukprot:OUM58224.1 hypothetical protein PIROE2DRAFT_16567 [Piromyces sp. E2]
MKYTLTEDFNKYSKENELDLELNMFLFSAKNMTVGSDNYESTIDVLLKKKSTEYALYVYDPLHTRRYAPHFVDLKEMLGEEYINTFSYDAYQTSVYEDQWVSLPIFLKYKALYSNKIYLEKYKREVPQTWDELIETSEYIINKERENNNFNLVGYNGLFPNGENAMCSIYEFIYSFRETKESPFPGFNSQTAVDALNILKKVKEKTSNDETFRSDEKYNLNMILSGNILFSTLWDGMPLSDYKETPLPGKNKDVNGSCLGGFNIGISKYISKENIFAALKVIKFFTSEEEQKKIASTYGVRSSVKNIYNDEEFCKKVDCEFSKNVQGITRPSSNFENYEQYSSKVMSIFNKFLFGNKSAKEALTEIDNITRIHVFSYKNFMDVENGRNYNICKYSNTGKVITVFQGITIGLVKGKGKLLGSTNQPSIIKNTFLSSIEDTQISTEKSETESKPTVELKSKSKYKILNYHYYTGINTSNDKHFFL